MQMLKTVCCWGTDYCKCRWLGISRNRNIKLTYIILIYLASMVVSVVSLNVQLSDQILNRLQCNSSKQKIQCSWQQTLFRVSIGFSIMHFILFLMMMQRNELSKIINEGSWLMKCVFLTTISLLFVYAVPGGLLGWIHTASAYVSPLWYLIQSLIIVDMIYSIDGLFSKQTKKNSKFYILQAIVSLLSVGLAIFLNVESYLSVADNSSKAVPIVNSVALALGLIVLLLRFFQGNSLLILGLLAIYANLQGLWLVEGSHSAIEIVIKLVLVFSCLLAILYPGSNKIRTKKSSVNEILALNTNEEEEDLRYVSSNKWIMFHCLFFLITFVLPTIIIYGSLKLSNQASSAEYQSMMHAGEIFNLAAAYLIYAYTLIATRFYPDQDFSTHQHIFRLTRELFQRILTYMKLSYWPQMIYLKAVY